MDPKFSKFESQINQFLNSNIPIKNIVKYFQKDPKSIYNAINRIKKKKNNILVQERDRRGRISKISQRAIRALNRDITRSPRKTKQRILDKN